MKPAVTPLVLIIAVTLACVASAANIQPTPVDYETSAVDIHGVRHFRNQYPGRHAPWQDDMSQAFAPDHPYGDRSLHHQGKGLFQITLDTKTGAVTEIAVVKSTGFSSLDSAAIASLRHWRWKPGKWKQINLPIAFELSKGSPRLKPGQTPLPHLPRS
jgi:TonB family protein